jgi:hypothetical protein
VNKPILKELFSPVKFQSFVIQTMKGPFPQALKPLKASSISSFQDVINAVFSGEGLTCEDTGEKANEIRREGKVAQDISSPILLSMNFKY